MKYYIDLQGISVRKFAEQNGLTYNNLSQILRNDRPLGIGVLYQLHAAIPDFDVNWVLFGGERKNISQKEYIADSNIVAEPSSHYESKVDPGKEMILKYLEDSAVQEKIHAIINGQKEK